MGKELPKVYREIVSELVKNQGWRYDRLHGTHPKVFPADASKWGIPVLTSPGSKGLLRGFIGQVKRAGGIWPPPARK